MIVKFNRDDFIYLPLNLRFFDEGEKTEQATPKKKEKAREEGQVAKSQEVSTAFLLVAVFFSLRYFANNMFNRMLDVYAYSFSLIPSFNDMFDTDFMPKLVSFMFMQSILIAMPLLLVALVVGVLSNLAQVGWHISTKALAPKLSNLNPIKGFKRLFSMRAVVDLVKSLAKFAVILYVIYTVVQKKIGVIPTLMEMDLMQGMLVVGDLIVNLGVNVGMMFMFIALADYAYTRFKHNKDLKMSKHEIKEEYKQAEGNQQVKGKIRQKMREVSMRRMMSDVPTADVIITNPTHFAVAIKYDKLKGDAPIVVAKGADYMAKRIREKAMESDIAIVENVALARTLYSAVEIGREIPPELYQAVAEVLAFVYKLKNVGV